MALAALGLALLVSFGTDTGTTAVEPLTVTGSQIFPPEVYLALIGKTRPPFSPRDQSQVESRVREFLQRAGYDLARVWLAGKDGRWVLEVDEGRLERIVFPGQRGLGAIRLQLSIALPGHVFHRPSLERQLAELIAEEDVDVRGYRLVPVHGTREGPIQLENLGTVRGEPIVPAAGRYELWIFTREEPLPPGVHFDAGVRPPDGIVLGAKLRLRGPWLEESRSTIAADAGIRPDELIKKSPLGFFSRATVRLGWLSPPLEPLPLRLEVSPSLLWVRRGRPDLAIDAYEVLRLDPHVGVRIMVREDVDVGIRFGAERRWLIAAVGAPLDADLRPPDFVAPFLAIDVELRLGQREPEQRHILEGSFRQLLGGASRAEWTAEYRTIWALGYDDIEIELGYDGAAGRTSIDSEPRFSDRLRGLYGDQIHCGHAAGLEVEYRMSLARELYKVGALLLGGACSPPEGVPLQPHIGAAALGFAFHGLVLDTFRIGAYVVAGLSTEGQLGNSIGLSVSQEL